jgi:hypothetical protein
MGKSYKEIIMKTIPKKETFPIVSGNLFDYVEKMVRSGNNGSSVIVPHVCNNINSFGAGFAAELAHYYPIVKENYHLLGSHFLKHNLGYVQFIEVYKDTTFDHKLIFANMISQNGTISQRNTRPLNYLALVKCMNQINNFITKNFNNDSLIQIHAPRFGCGLAGGNWDFITDLIQDIWTNQKVFVYNYSNKSQTKK